MINGRFTGELKEQLNVFLTMVPLLKIMSLVC